MHHPTAKGEPRLGIEPADLADHVRQILRIHPADALQRVAVVAGQKLQVRHQRLHGGIEPVALPELDGEAFGKVAGADPGRLEGLNMGEHRLHIRAAGAQLLGGLVEIAGEITRLVDEADEMEADESLRRIGLRHRELRLQVIGQGGLGS